MIREKREFLGLTQKELAFKVKINFSYLSKIENRQIGNISLRVLKGLSNVLDLHILDLIDFLDIA